MKELIVIERMQMRRTEYQRNNKNVLKQKKRYCLGKTRQDVIIKKNNKRNKQKIRRIIVNLTYNENFTFEKLFKLTSL